MSPSDSLSSVVDPKVIIFAMPSYLWYMLCIHLAAKEQILLIFMLIWNFDGSLEMLHLSWRVFVVVGEIPDSLSFHERYRMYPEG